MDVAVLDSSSLFRKRLLLAMCILLEVVVGLLAEESLDELVLDLLLSYIFQFSDVRQSGCLELVLRSCLLSAMGNASLLILNKFLTETLRVRSVLDLPNLAGQVASEVVATFILAMVRHSRLCSLMRLRRVKL